jgi:hypothetical protein
MTPKRQFELGYGFVPLPQWVNDSYERGEMSEEAFDLQRVLFRRADFTALASRSESPRLKLTTLARALRRDDADEAVLETLARFVRGQRERGRLEYRIEGNARHGRNQLTYVFTLFGDGERPFRPRSAKNEAERSVNRDCSTPRTKPTTAQTDAAPIRQSREAEEAERSGKEGERSVNNGVAKRDAEPDSVQPAASSIRSLQNSPENLGLEETIKEEVLGRTTDEQHATVNGSSSWATKPKDDDDERLRPEVREWRLRESEKPAGLLEAIAKAEAAQQLFPTPNPPPEDR